MGNTGVIDNFLGVFTSYIDSGFGLLGGEVVFIATTLIVIDVTLAALFWAWGADDDIIARLVKKTLFVGVFAYIISNWNNLARIVFESFAGLGLMASGTGFSVTDLMRPGRVAQTGLDAGRPLLESISDLMGWISFFENFIQIACLLFAWALVVLAFFILAVQLFVTLLEFKLTTLAGFVLIPFGHKSGLAEEAEGNQHEAGERRQLELDQSDEELNGQDEEREQDQRPGKKQAGDLDEILEEGDPAHQVGDGFEQRPGGIEAGLGDTARPHQIGCGEAGTGRHQAEAGKALEDDAG